MALQKQTIPLVFSNGADTKSDPKSVQTKLLTLVNGRFTAPNEITPRNGFASKTRDVIGSGTDISTGRRLMPYRDQLALIDDTSLYSYSEAATGWVNKGGMVSAQVSQRGIAKGPSNQFNGTTAIHSSGFQAFAWSDGTTGGFSYTIIDIGTGATIVGPSAITSSGTDIVHIEVQVIGSYFVFVYMDNGTLSYKYVNVTTPTTLSNATTIDTGTISAGTGFCTTVVNSQLYVMWGDGGPAVKVTYYTTTTLLTGVPTTTATIESKTVNYLTVFGEATTNNIICAYWNATDSNLRFRVYNSALTAVTAAATISTPIYAVDEAMTGISVASNTFTLYYEGVGTGTDKVATLLSVTVTNSGGVYTPGSPARFKSGCFLASKAFANGTSIYLTVQQVDDISVSTFGDGTFFVIDSSGNVVARIFDELGSGLRSRADDPNISEVYTYNSNYYFSVDFNDLLTTESGFVATSVGIAGVTLDLYDADFSYSHGELADALHISGGFLWEFDGQSLVEHGFHVPPQYLVSNSPGAGSFVYSYVACYEWTDANGYLHRSKPSAVLSYNQAAAIAGGTPASVKVPYLSFTRKTSSTNPVQLVLYRTVQNGTVFYKTTSAVNSTTLDYATISDTTTDANLVGAVQLYTTGNVLDNQPAPPFRAMTVYNARMWGINSLNPNEIWYSKQCTPGVPVEWSDFLTLTLPEGAQGKCLAVMDGKLVVSSENKFYVLAGLGPDDTGANSDYGLPTEIASDVGCTVPRSFVRIPSGLIFKSDKGFYLLDRSLQMHYVGADVEDFNTYTVTSAVLAPKTNEVRITFSDNDDALVYDYLMNQWGWDDNHVAVDACVYDNTYHHLTSDGKAKAETPGTHNDDGAEISPSLETGWIQFGGIQGFQRVYRFLLLGEYVSPHTLQVGIAYDFVDSNTTGTVSYSQDPEPYQHRFHLKKQKCEAIKISIDATPTSPIGQGLKISSLAFEVGVKKGPYKLSAAKSSTPSTGPGA